MKHSSKAFSLIELLVAFALLAIIAGLILPRYVNLQRATNIQIAQQQVDAVKKALYAWMGSQPSLDAVNTAYGNNTAIDGTTLTSIIQNYADPSFASRIAATGSPVKYFTTTEMQNITGNKAATSATVNFNGKTVTFNVSGGQMQYPKDSSGKYIAYGMIYWPTDSASRRFSQPAVVLFVPNENASNVQQQSGATVN